MIFFTCFESPPMSDYNVDEPEDEYMADEYDMDILEDDVNPDFDGIDIGVEDFDQLVLSFWSLIYLLFCILYS